MASDTPPSTYLRTVVPSALAMMLGNIDRICLSVAMLPLAAEMGWAEGAQGIVQSAFLWGYVSTQLIGGTLADRYGGKRVMAVGMLFFSLASMLLPLVAITPFTESLGIVFPAVLLSRFLVGLVRIGSACPCVCSLSERATPSPSFSVLLPPPRTTLHYSPSLSPPNTCLTLSRGKGSPCQA